jgi:hypothetical protein
MKIFKCFLTFFVSVFIASCGILPLKTEMKVDHFRFENFKRDISSPSELVYLMCYRKKPTHWSEPKQYLGGEHELWVEANISEPTSPTSDKEAFVLFKIKLDSGKSYMLNRKIEGEKISIWIQDTESGLKVSKVITTDLNIAAFGKRTFRKKRCKSGSI